jgi:hypothetical protein
MARDDPWHSRKSRKQKIKSTIKIKRKIGRGVCLYPARSTTSLQTAWTLAILEVLSTTYEHYRRPGSTTKGKAESGTSALIKITWGWSGVAKFTTPEPL